MTRLFISVFSVLRHLDQLPRANVIFMRYLFGCLHNIEQHSSSNQMTAYNLSLCISPSILCLSNSGSSENFTKQVTRSLIFMPCGAESPSWTCSRSTSVSSTGLTRRPDSPVSQWPSVRSARNKNESSRYLFGEVFWAARIRQTKKAWCYTH